jgi:cytochrome c peroxidase
MLRWAAWLGVVILVFTGDAPAQAPGQLTTMVPVSADQEPITPIPAPPAADPFKLVLGEELFEDPRLSHDKTRACSSCHDTRTNGADGNRRDDAPDGSRLAFNTNTVFNAALSFRFNWEGNYRTLEQHAESSLNNPRLMGSSVGEAVARLNADAEMVRQFRRAYGRDPDRASLLNALATYERSLLTPGGRFDRWLEGDVSALNAQEKQGYALFKSFGCVSCHQGVNVGGNLYEIRGVFHSLGGPRRDVMRVPSLRNVAATPPYFHDGSAATLPDAVRKMAATQLDQNLTEEQADAIVAFLNTLTGTYGGSSVAKAKK